MACILNGNELTLAGDVGDLGYGDHFTQGDIIVALAQVDEGAALTVYLNSAGGIATEGAAIHALLARRRGITDIVVDGIAASAASLIAMAGKTVTMSAGAVMMIHDPSGFTFGTVAAHAQQIHALETLATSYARVYADKSGKSESACRSIMVAETWFSPQEAVAARFADKVGSGSAKPVAAFDYRTFAHAPDRLVALAREKNWTRPTASSPQRTNQPQETTMAKPNDPPNKASKPSLRAVMQSIEKGVNGRRLTPQEREAKQEEEARMSARSTLHAAVDASNRRC